MKILDQERPLAIPVKWENANSPMDMVISLHYNNISIRVQYNQNEADRTDCVYGDDAY